MSFVVHCRATSIALTFLLDIFDYFLQVLRVTRLQTGRALSIVWALELDALGRTTESLYSYGNDLSMVRVFV